MQDSLHARQSKTVLNSGFHVVDSGFQVLNSGLLINGKQWLTGFRIPWAELRIPSPGFRIPRAKIFKSSESGFPYRRDKIMGKRMTYRFVYLRLLHNNWATGWLTLIAFYGRSVVCKTRGWDGGRGLSFFFLKNAALGLKSNPNPNPNPNPGPPAPAPIPIPRFIDNLINHLARMLCFPNICRSFDVLQRIGALSCHKLLVHMTEDKFNLEGNSSYSVASHDQRRGNKTNKL